MGEEGLAWLIQLCKHFALIGKNISRMSSHKQTYQMSRGASGNHGQNVQYSEAHHKDEKASCYGLHKGPVVLALALALTLLVHFFPLGSQTTGPHRGINLLLASEPRHHTITQVKKAIQLMDIKNVIA